VGVSWAKTSNLLARIGERTPQRNCFAAGALHLKTTVPAEKVIGDVLLRNQGALN
jgi:hypothetical protein